MVDGGEEFVMHNERKGSKVKQDKNPNQGKQRKLKQLTKLKGDNTDDRSRICPFF